MIQEYKKEFFYITVFGVKISSIQTVHSIEFKFGMYIIGKHQINAADFGEFLMHSFFTGIQKRSLIHYDLLSQIL